MKIHISLFLALAGFSIAAAAQPSPAEISSTREGFYTTLRSVGQAFKEAEPAREAGMKSLTESMSQSDQDLLIPRLGTRDLDLKFVIDEGEAIVRYAKAGDHYTAAYQTGKLIASGKTLAADYLALSTFYSKDTARRSECLRQYNALQAALFHLEYAFQQYYGVLSWPSEK